MIARFPNRVERDIGYLSVIASISFLLFSSFGIAQEVENKAGLGTLGAILAFVLVYTVKQYFRVLNMSHPGYNYPSLLVSSLIGLIGAFLLYYCVIEENALRSVLADIFGVLCIKHAIDTSVYD